MIARTPPRSACRSSNWSRARRRRALAGPAGARRRLHRRRPDDAGPGRALLAGPAARRPARRQCRHPRGRGAPVRAARASIGGELTRIAVAAPSRSAAYTGWRPLHAGDPAGRDQADDRHPLRPRRRPGRSGAADAEGAAHPARGAGHRLSGARAAATASRARIVAAASARRPAGDRHPHAARRRPVPAGRDLRRAPPTRSPRSSRPAATSPCCARAIRSSTARSCISTRASPTAARSQVVPGVSSLMACAGAAGRRWPRRNDMLTVLPAPLADDALRARLAGSRGRRDHQGRPPSRPQFARLLTDCARLDGARLCRARDPRDPAHRRRCAICRRRRALFLDGARCHRRRRRR